MGLAKVELFAGQRRVRLAARLAEARGAVVVAPKARNGQGSRAALRPTVCPADGAAPLANRGGEKAELRSLAVVLDRHAPLLTLSLGGGSFIPGYAKMKL